MLAIHHCISHVLNGGTEVVELLLARKADIEMQNDDGDTALHVACLNGHTDVVQALLEKGAPVVTSAYGGTLLHIACRYGHTSCSITPRKWRRF